MWDFKLMKYSILVLCTLFISPLFAATCGTTVLWHNASDLGPLATNPGISSSVINQNIDIVGTNALVGGINVVASSCDVLITVTTTSSTVTGTGNRQDGVPTSAAQLYLFAGLGHSITFSLSQDLLFRGTATNAGGTLLDLLVTASGPGSIIFNIGGGETLTFTSLSTTGGALFYGVMDSSPSNITFERIQSAANDRQQDVTVHIGQRSLMGYVSANTIASNGGASDSSIMTFDTANTGTGRMVLRMENNSEFLIAGRQVNTSISSNFNLSNIILTTPAGKNAQLDVINSTSGTGGSLLIINYNSVFPNLVINPFCDGAFLVTGTQAGFILGANAELTVGDGAYIDYVGATTNVIPTVQLDLSEELTELGLTNQSIVKLRNGSAFIVDDNSNSKAVPPLINMLGASAIYFRSGCDEDGAVQEKVDGVFSFTIDPTEVTIGAGNLVFDVEGSVDVVGTATNALHVLSWQVTPTGGPIFVRSGQTTFPLRTFATDSNGHNLQYNNAYMQINREMRLHDMYIVHDDENHLVYEKDDVRSEPTYVGGEYYNLIVEGVCTGNKNCTSLQSHITFFNSNFLFNTSAALTGVDLLIPNLQGENNNTNFIFYSNGRIVDSGSGRNVILGTDVGAFAADGGTLINRDCQLNIFQTTADPSPGTLTLTFTVQPNDATVNNAITTPYSTLVNQASIQTPYLGHASNISIGTNDTVGTDTLCNSTFALTSIADVIINGCFFSFDTRGGTLNYPQESNVTGQGGIFVDSNGRIDANPTFRVNISTMVTKSRNGIINLPANQVFFNSRVGIADWQLTLTDPTQLTIIPAGSVLSDYTLDWISVTKNYVTTNSLVPYELINVPVCQAPPIVASNLQSIPEIHGQVEQFQVTRSRLGDMVNLKIGNGGFIRELVFLTGFDSAEAAVGFLVIQDDGRVGLGNASRNYDSNESPIILGINGVTIVPNGDGQVIVNDTLLINNICHILSGTAFGVSGQQFLTFQSETPQEVRVKKGGILDLSSFTSTNQVIEFSGKTNLVVENGAMVVVGGLLRFSGESQLIIERNLDDFTSTATSVASSDGNRCQFVGQGTVEFIEGSGMAIEQEAILGIETYPGCQPTTNIIWSIQDQAKVLIGSSLVNGGAWQVGNTVASTSNSITFSLILNGTDSVLQLGQAGFFGLGAGIVEKTLGTAPNSWTIGSLFNVNNITMNVQNGSLIANNILSGDQINASLLAIGGSSTSTAVLPTYSFNFDLSSAVILGGSNIVQIAPTTTSINPTVTNFAGVFSTDLSVGMLSSLGQLADPYTGPQQVNVSPTALFNYLAMRTVSTTNRAYASPRACISANGLNQTIVGYVFSSSIFRSIAPRIKGENGTYVDPRQSINKGSVNILVNSDGSIASLTAYS